MHNTTNNTVLNTITAALTQSAAHVQDLRHELASANTVLVGQTKVSNLLDMAESMTKHATFVKKAKLGDLDHEMLARIMASAWNDGRIALTSTLFTLIDLEVKMRKMDKSGRLAGHVTGDAPDTVPVDGCYETEDFQLYKRCLERLNVISMGREAIFRISEELASMTESDGGRNKKANAFGDFDRAAEKRKPFQWLFTMDKAGYDEEGDWSEWTEAGPIKQSFDDTLRASISGMARKVEEDTRKEFEGRPVDEAVIEAKVKANVERFVNRRQEAVEAVIIAYHGYVDEIFSADEMTYEDAIKYANKNLDWSANVERIADKQYRIWTGEIDKRVTDFTHLALPWSPLYKDWLSRMLKQYETEVESYKLTKQALAEAQDLELQLKQKRAELRAQSGASALEAAKALLAGGTPDAPSAPSAPSTVEKVKKAAVTGYAAFINTYKQGQRPIGIR